MPASSAEVIGVALQSAYRHKPVDTAPSSLHKKNHIEDQLLASSKQVLLNHVEYDRVGTQQSLVLSSLKTKYVNLTASDPTTPTSPSGSMAHAHHKPSFGVKEDQLDEPHMVLWPRDKVILGWKKTFPPGAGMVNMGNTCYLNSSLQALFHIPAMANWLIEDLSSHTTRCENISGNASYCSVCAMMRTFRSTLDRSNTVIKPSLIQHKLKSIGKTLMYGRQEDAHEFIKLLLDHMEKSYLTFRRATKLDHRSKETTPLNQIFGGYIRQQVICPLCRHVSTTFSHFQDLVLDIRSVNSVEDALNLHFKKETLDVDNAYKCERCHKKVPATKRHLIERAPHVLLIQLKRFTISGGKIGKHISIQRMIDISKFVNGANKHQSAGGPYQYRLASMVIHLGGSQHGGHYTAVAEASSGTMFEFDDSSVRSISLQSALLRNPYILFYEMVRKPKDTVHIKQVVRQSSEKVLIRQNSDGVCKPLPTSHSASSVANGFGRATDCIGEPDSRNSIQNPTNKPPLPAHKERERISFGMKLNQSSSKGENTSKPNKIILKSGTTTLLGAKSSVTLGSSTSNSTPGKASSAPKSVSSLVPYLDDSEDSEVDDSKRGVVKTHKEKSLQNGKVKSDDKKVIKPSGIKNAKSERMNGSLHLQKTEKLSNGDIKSDSKCTESDNSVKSQSSNKSGSMSFMPRSLQVVNNHTESTVNSSKGKADSGWLITDASLHSPSESSCSSVGGLHTSPFTVVDQPTSCKLEQKQQEGQAHEKPENQGWTVTIRRQRPELEKSHSHDSVLPGPSHKKDEPDSASLKSKASVDSCRSDRSTKSMKKSLFSLFTCVSSRSPDSPEDEQPEASHLHEDTQECNELKSLGGDNMKHTDAESKTSKCNGTTSLHSHKEGKKEAAYEFKRKAISSHSENGHHSSESDTDNETENSQTKRCRDQDDTEPSSPSKKCRPEDKAKSSKKSEQETSKNGFSSNTSKNGPSNGHDPKPKTKQCNDSDVSKNGVIHENGKSKNGLLVKGRKGHRKNKEQKQDNSSTCNGEETSKVQNDCSSSASASSLSGSLSDSESSESDGDQEGTECWVEKTKETLGKAKTNPGAHVVHWNSNMKDLSHALGRNRENEQTHDHERENVKEVPKRSGMWDGSRSTEVVDELRRAGNFAYGAKVNTWGGGRSITDQETEKERKEMKKRTADDLYNEEFDSGRTKKIKTSKKCWESQRWDRSSSNEFQKVQDLRNSGSWTPHNHHNHSPHQYPSPHFNNQHPRHSYWNKHRDHYHQRNKPWNKFGMRDHKFHKKHKEKYKHWDRRD